MKTLIIYDNAGKIWVTMTGAYTIPVGLPYIETEIQNGFYAESVDTTTKQPILKEYPKSQQEKEIENLKNTTEELTLAVADLLGGVV